MRAKTAGAREKASKDFRKQAGVSQNTNNSKKANVLSINNDETQTTTQTTTPRTMSDIPPKAPTNAPGAFLLVGEAERKEKRKALRSSRDNRRTPYQTPEQFAQLLDDCTSCGKLVTFSDNDENMVYYQHPYSLAVYSRTDKRTGETTLWFESNGTTGDWKQIVHNGLYKLCTESLYQQVLDGEIDDYTGNPANNKSDFATLLTKTFQMCETGGWSKYVKDNFWDKEEQCHSFSLWRAKKKRAERLQNAEAKKRKKERKKAAKQQQQQQKQKRRKTEASPSVSITMHQSGINVNLLSPAPGGNDEFLASLFSSAGRAGVIPSPNE